MEEKEEWKNIPGYQDYQISNFGRVKSLEHTVYHQPSNKFPNGRLVTYQERILKPSLESGGYYFVVLYNNKIKRSFRIHRLVAKLFIPNPKNYEQVNHKDENKLNNHVSNLEWCTAKYNINYGTGKYRKTINRRIPIIQYTLDGKFVAEYESATAAAYALGLPQYYARDILYICYGKKGKTLKNFKWTFKYNK